MSVLSGLWGTSKVGAKFGATATGSAAAGAGRAALAGSKNIFMNGGLGVGAIGMAAGGVLGGIGGAMNPESEIWNRDQGAAYGAVSGAAAGLALGLGAGAMPGFAKGLFSPLKDGSKYMSRSESLGKVGPMTPAESIGANIGYAASYPLRAASKARAGQGEDQLYRQRIREADAAAEAAKPKDPFWKSVNKKGGLLAGSVITTGLAASYLGGKIGGAGVSQTAAMYPSPLNEISGGYLSHADEKYGENQANAFRYESTVINNPYAYGQRDTDDAYTYNRSTNRSVFPTNPGQVKRQPRGIRPGEFNDTGSLVLALNDLRRG